MTKDTGVPPQMYPTPSRRGGRGAAPGVVHRRTPQFQNQRPPQPSSAAAKAAAAAKAFHRKAQERAKAKQQLQQQQQQQQEAEEKHIGSSSESQSNRPEQRNDVFRRSPNQEAEGEDQKAAGGSLLKKVMTTGPDYRVGPTATADVKYQATPSTGGEESKVSTSASAPPNYPPGHPGAQYQHHPHMMYGHPTPYGHPPHYPFAHPHYHNASNRKSKESYEQDGQDSSPSKKSEPNHQQHYYAPNYHQGPHYPPHLYYDGRNYSSYPHYHGQNPHHPHHLPHQFYNTNHHGTTAPHPDGNNSAGDNKATNKSSAPSGPPLEEHDYSNTARGPTRHVMGSHTSIHVPRESMLEGDGAGKKSGPTPEKESLPGKTRNDTIFRSGEDEGRDLLESTEILLSLSKSFDNGDVVTHDHNTRGKAKKTNKTNRNNNKTKSKKGYSAATGTPSKNSSLERPKSPDDPPRIHHFHKQTNMRTFEPQPSPLKMDQNDIELAPSFQLFNQSFDMNLENLIGPNASFGLGPMKSLSFGLGLPNPSDVGASPRASPISIHGQNARMSPRVAADAAGADFASVYAQPKLDEGMSSLQVLRASPSNSFGNVIRRENIQAKEDGSNSVVVLGDSARIGTFHAAPLNETPPQTDSKKRKNGQSGGGSARKKTKDFTTKRKKAPQKLDPSLFEVFARHHSAFAKFAFLLPGAKDIFNERSNLSENAKPSESDEEIASRRINSALCAFGGVAIPPSHSIGVTKSDHEKEYENRLSERYYEEENRLSWETETDANSPVVIDSEDDEHDGSKGGTKKNKNKAQAGPSLQRAIGVMVYPAVNAFTAAEPGIMTPALDEMNNFVDSPSRSTPLKGETTANGKEDQSLPLVSPDYVKTPQRSINYAGGAWMSNHHSPVNVTPGKECESPTDLLFVDTQELLPEQYRIVNMKKCKGPSSRYVYPALPLPYGQRKRISNAMFAMSKSISGLTDECAAVLVEARKNDAWDFAVAQIMTQVIVLTHCSVEDSRLDGLSKYLLTLGIAA